MHTSTRDRGNVVVISRMVSADLALRDWADGFFDKVEALPSERITVDFSGVHSISSSFAHQYLLRKSRAKKKIGEMNVPQNVKKMFEVVKKPSGKDRFPALRRIETIPARIIESE